MTIFSMIRRWALLLAALAGLGWPSLGVAREAPAAAAEPPRPAIWVIEDEDTRIYLFGTVHAFPASVVWRSAALDRVIAEADELVMETPESEPQLSDPERLFRSMALGKSVSILSRVSPAIRPALAAMIAQTGLPMEAYDQMTTWGVGFLLSGYQISQAYAENGQPVAMSGAEEVLGRIFRKSRRPISGVETVEDQLRVFSTMPHSVQRMFLESTVAGFALGAAGQPEPEPTTEESLTDRAWLRGDVEAIGAEMLQMPPEIYEPLLTRRNRNWTRWLEQRMQRPGIVLFAVGAGHLAGPHSVQTMLAERGITARRID